MNGGKNRMKESLWKQTYENILIGMGFHAELSIFKSTSSIHWNPFGIYRVSEVEARKSVVSDWLCRCGAKGRDHDRLYRTWGSVGT